ncbi:MAG: hypothetical protein D6826_10210 [Alphaproteobacteria bacterium]|nr:MAG: hypothetical protein D6826_10210 [Alphaproteobacteria bacterium]
MARIGLISNIHSQQNRRGMAAIRDTAARHANVVHAEIDRIEDLGQALGDFIRHGVDVIALNGGDGTVQAALTALINTTAPKRRPRLAILPGGMTNLIAHDVGLKGRRADSLARLAHALADGRGITEATRPVLSLRRSPDEAPVHGMFLGAAAFYRAVMFSRQKIHPMGLERGAAFTSSLALVVLRAFFGRGNDGSDDLLRGARFSIAVPENGDVPAPQGEGEKEYLLFLATTLARLPLGLRPFWSEGAGRCRYTYIESPPHRLRAALLPILAGRPRPWMRRNGYVSGCTNEIVLRMNTPIVFDGQFFTPAPGHPMVLRSDHDVVFMRC